MQKMLSAALKVSISILIKDVASAQGLGSRYQAVGFRV